MTDDLANNPGLSDAAKKAVAGLRISRLADAGDLGDASPKSINIDSLKSDAQMMVETLQQMIASAMPGDADTQKLYAALSKLQGALQGGGISREALAAALSEAATVISAADSAGKGLSPEQKRELIWQTIDKDNKDIDDDFKKMRTAGVVFEEKLWHRHSQLSEYLHDHPHDIQKQKELDAVDDVLLLQAEPQLKKHPNAQADFDDAKKKSKERHELVDHDLTGMEKKSTSQTNANMDWDEPAPNVGQKTKSMSMNNAIPR